MSIPADSKDVARIIGSVVELLYRMVHLDFFCFVATGLGFSTALEDVSQLPSMRDGRRQAKARACAGEDHTE